MLQLLHVYLGQASLDIVIGVGSLNVVKRVLILKTPDHFI